MRKLLLSTIIISAALGPICPLQWTAYAAPLVEDELLMTVMPAADRLACDSPESTSSRQTGNRGQCPTDRCLSMSDHGEPMKDIASAPEIVVKDAPVLVFSHPVQEVSPLVSHRSSSLLAFNDPYLTVVKRE